MFTTRERFYRPPQHRQSLPLSHNPDSRVSKVFIVLCLPLSDFHGDVVSFTRRCYQSVKLANEYAGNCTRFSTSRFRSNLFLLRTYSQKKGGHETKKKAKTSNQQALQGSPCLARLQYHILKKKLSPHLQESKHTSQFFNVSFNKITFFPALCVFGHIAQFCCEFVQVFFQCGKHFPLAFL